MKNRTHIFLIISAIILLPVIGFILKQKFGPGLNIDQLAGEKFISANPVDFSQVIAISRFRACAGHWYGQTDIYGIAESSSNMKHYFVPLESLSPSQDKVKIFATFNGKIAEVIDDQRGKIINLVPENSGNWVFTIYHINPAGNVRPGNNVKAGELMGYAAINKKGDSFDFSLLVKSGRGGYNHLASIDSIFFHFTDSVKNEYDVIGATTQEMVISRADREESPCQCIRGEPNTTTCDFEYAYLDSKDYFKIK